MKDPTEILAAARDGLQITVERYAGLVETQADTSTPIPGSEWSVRDAAVHVAGGNHRHIAYATGEGPTAPTLDKESFDSRVRSQLAANPETDPKKLADQIREGFAQLMAVTATLPADQPIAYHAGLRPNLAQLACVLLGEYLLHGYDTATATGTPWPIDPELAALAVGAYRLAYPLTFNPQAAAGLQATYRIDVPGTDPFFVCIDAGTYAEPVAPPSVDCAISADAVTALLVQTGRLSQWPAIALGRLTFSGRRPEVGPRFAELFVFP